MREQWVLQPASLRSEGGAKQRQQPARPLQLPWRACRPTPPRTCVAEREAAAAAGHLAGPLGGALGGRRRNRLVGRGAAGAAHAAGRCRCLLLLTLALGRLCSRQAWGGV